MANISVDDLVEIGNKKGVNMASFKQKLMQKFGSQGVPEELFSDGDDPTGYLKPPKLINQGLQPQSTALKPVPGQAPVKPQYAPPVPTGQPQPMLQAPREDLDVASQFGITTPAQPQPTQTPMQPHQPQPQQQSLADIISMLQGQKSNYGVRQNLSDALSIIGGGKANYFEKYAGDENDYSKLIAQEAIKKQFEEPSYVVSYDKEGNPVFNQAPGNIKNAPFYASPQGGQYYGAKTRQAEAQAENFELGSGLVKDSLSGQGQVGGVRPGTTVTSGGITVPLNPKLTEAEGSAVSALRTFEPQIEDIAQSIRGGVFEPGGKGVLSNLKRTYQQASVDQPGMFGRLLTSTNPNLQAIQSELNSVRRYAFGEGGKNLTDTEKNIVFALLDTTGKSDNQIIEDHQKAIQILRAKEQIALGGANAVSQNMVGSVNNQNNQPKQLDPQTAQQILQQAGGDKDKARQIARSQGYSF